MSLIPFNIVSYQRLVHSGYKYILVEGRYRDEYSALNNAPDVQILKALWDCNGIPINTDCEPIDSDKITSFLSDKQTNCFVIISD